MENWKDIKNYEGIYQVSDLGRVKSLKFGKEKILKPCRKSRKYESLILWKDSSIKYYKIHQLVAIAFLNHEPCGMEKVVDHINNNPFDNRLVNLQVISSRENNSKDVKNKTSKYTGVRLDSRGCWRSEITTNGKKKHLGYFQCETKAHLAYQKALKLIK